MRHIVVSYYIKDNVCRTFMRHIVVSYFALTGFMRSFICRVILKKLTSSAFVSYSFTLLRLDKINRKMG